MLPQRWTKSSWERCSVHVLPNLPGGLIPARGESVVGNPGRLGAVGMDALPSLTAASSPRAHFHAPRCLVTGTSAACG